MQLEYTQKATIFFKKMAVARSVFTLDGVVQVFWAAFDMPMTVVPLKVALGLEKFNFWHLKNNRKNSLNIHLHDYFFEMTKHGTTVMGRSKAAKKLKPPTYKVNIE